MIDPLQDFLERLKKVQKRGLNQWTASCPAHDDKTPSLSVSLGDDGRLLVHCHAGCSFESILAAAGVDQQSPSRADAKRPPPKRNSKPRRAVRPLSFTTRDELIKYLEKQLGGTLAGEWTYLNRNSEEVFRVVRIENFRGKSGKQYRPFYRSGATWILGDPEGPLPLYGLPAVIEANTIWVGEGEKCADLFRQIGVIATTSAHGAKSSKNSDWSALAGKNVILCPDHDSAGEEFIQNVEGHLSELMPAPTVKIVRLPVEGEGDDIEQYLEACWSRGQTNDRVRAELEGLAEKVAVVFPRPELNSVRLSNVTPSIQEYLWNNRIPAATCSLIGGPQGATKNLFAYEIIACVTTGRPWPDNLIGQRRPPQDVILLEAEEHLESSIVPRLQAAGADLNRIEVIKGAPLAKSGHSRFISIKEDADKIRRLAQQMGDVALIVISPITSYLGDVEQNSNEQVRNEIIHPLKQLAEDLNCAVVILKHPNKDWRNNDPLQRIGGSAAWTEAMRCVIFVGVDPTETDKQNPRRCALWEKFSIGPKPAPMSWRIRITESGQPALQFLNDPVNFTAKEMLAGSTSRRKSKIAAAVEWIMKILNGGPQLAAKLNELAEKAIETDRQFSRDAFDRAKAKLNKEDRLKCQRRPGQAVEWWIWLATQPAPEWFRPSSNDGPTFAASDSSETPTDAEVAEDGINGT